MKKRVLCWVLGALVSVGCSRSAPAPQGEDKSAASAKGVEAKAEATRLAASILTIAHAEVEEYASAKPRPTRSKAEALALANKIAAEARHDPGRFGELARQYSEDPKAAEGGALGAWEKGANSDIEPVLERLAVGAISEPIDSPYGYRILRRDEALPSQRISARHLVVAFTGATRAPASLSRSKEEARARAEALVAKARKDPGEFEALVRAESDAWDRDKGGALGAWTLNSGRYPAAFDRAIFGLNEGAISEPIESEFGYQIFQRITAAPHVELLAAAHILIAFEGAKKAGPSVHRTKEEALALANALADEARKQPERFGHLARERSDDATRERGGDLGSFRRGTKPKAIEEALVALQLGEVGGPVLTEYGYHVLLRREAPTEKNYVLK